MQDMIQKIIEADNEARAMEEANQQAAAEKRRKIEEEAAAIYQRYMDQAQEEISKSDAYLQKRSERKLRDISAKQESAYIKLQADYEHNRDRWVDEIVSRVIG